MDTTQLPHFVDRFRGPLIGLLAARGASPADAIELAQETFAEAYVSRGRFAGDWEDMSAVGAWLRGIATNLNRSRRRLRAVRTEPIGEREFADPASENVPENDEAGERMRQALARLEVSWRTVLMMRYVEGSGLPEIAELLGTSVRAVEGRLRRGRIELKRQLEADIQERTGRDEVAR